MENVALYGGINNKVNSIPQETVQNPVPRVDISDAKLQTLDKDTVNFRGKEEGKKKGSFWGTLAALGIVAGAAVAGLGFAHKYNTISKFTKEGHWADKVREYVPKVTEPCYNVCAKAKKCFNTAVEYVNNWKKSFCLPIVWFMLNYTYAGFTC